MAKKLEDRYQTLAEVAAALDQPGTIDYLPAWQQRMCRPCLLLAVGCGMAVGGLLLAFWLSAGRQLIVAPSVTKEPNPLAPSPAASVPHADNAPFVSLFNGRDLAGWHPLGHAGWSVKDGALVGETPNRVGWLMSDHEYANFELELEYKLSAGSNSGVFLRAWPEGDVNGADFHEVQLLDDAAPQFASFPGNWKTGAIFNHIAPNPTAKAPVDAWNRLLIRAQGNHVQVSINGARIVDGDLPPGKRASGRIGLQLYPKCVEFRNIRVRDLLKIPTEE